MAPLPSSAAVISPPQPDGRMDLLELGWRHRCAGRYRESAQSLSRLVEHCRTAYGDGSREHIAAMHQLGLTHVESGDADKAAEALSEALEAHNRLVPADPQLLGAIHLALGATNARRHQLELAEESYHHAAEVLTEAFGKDFPGATSAHFNLGLVYLEGGRLRQAKHHLLRAQALARCVLGPPTADLGDILCALGEAHLRAGDKGAAVDAYRKAVGALGRSCGERHARTSLARVDLAFALMQRRKEAEAIAQLLTARDAQQADAAGDAAELARTCRVLACVYVQAGRLHDAALTLRHLQQQLSTREPALNDDAEGPRDEAVGDQDGGIAKMLHAVHVLEKERNSSAAGGRR